MAHSYFIESNWRITQLVDSFIFEYIVHYLHAHHQSTLYTHTTHQTPFNHIIRFYRHYSKNRANINLQINTRRTPNICGIWVRAKRANQRNSQKIKAKSGQQQHHQYLLETQWCTEWTWRIFVLLIGLILLAYRYIHIVQNSNNTPNKNNKSSNCIYKTRST